MACMKTGMKILKSKTVYVVASLITQLVFITLLLTYFSLQFSIVYYILVGLSFIISLHVINRRSDSASKLLWVLMIMALPICGGMLYLLFGERTIPKALMIKDRQAYSDYKKYALQSRHVLTREATNDFVLTKMVNMGWNTGFFPVYENTEMKYYKTGEEQFAHIMEDLRNAKEFIFIETFILHDGKLWEEMLKVLEQKAAEGVDIRLMYDDWGSMMHTQKNYPDFLASKGIKAHPFNPMHAQLAIQMNNRDHRKIFVIDGKIAYTGGINISDEYANIVSKFGYWKDMGVRMAGPAVEMFTITFLQIWNYQDDQNTSYEEFIQPASSFEKAENPAYAIPFSDSPTDDAYTGMSMHMNMLNLATEYCWITTPYLILNAEMENTIELACSNGVDVRIIVPGIPDKKIVYEVTRANYRRLLEKGVRIYEYTPGFIHGKVFLSDDRNALVGTVNMDFRSYFFNYECGVWFQGGGSVKDIRADFEQLFADSHEITLQEVEDWPFAIRTTRSFLKVFSPIL